MRPVTKKKMPRKDKKKKRLRFTTFDHGKYDRPVVRIPIIREREQEEKSDEPKEKDCGVLIINPDGSSEKMEGEYVSQN